MPEQGLPGPPRLENTAKIMKFMKFHEISWNFMRFMIFFDFLEFPEFLKFLFPFLRPSENSNETNCFFNDLETFFHENHIFRKNG